MNRTEDASRRDPHRWIVFGTISLVYFFVYFHRVSTSVIVTDLLDAFQTNATALGFMSSMYFYVYAAEQPLVGYLSDKLGPRRVMGYWSVAAAAGCLVFGLAPDIGWATAGRAIIGIGVGGVYVPALKAFSLWFRRKEFGTMIGLLMSMGNLGAVIATAPLAWAAGNWGWRATFFGIGAVTLALAFATLFGTRDYSENRDTSGEPAPGSEKDSSGEPTPGSEKDSSGELTPGSEKDSSGEPTPAAGEGSSGKPGFIRVMASKQFWLAALVFFGIYGTLVTLQGLWATPFLMAVLGIERIAAGKLNMLIPVGVIFGAPFFGWLPGRFGLKLRRVLAGILSVYVLAWVCITFAYAQLQMAGLSATLLAMGFVAGGFISVLWGIVRETTPVEILGFTSGLLNPAPFFGVAVFQVLTGAILDRFGEAGGLYPVSGFQSAFSVCLAANAVCLGLGLFIRDADSKG